MPQISNDKSFYQEYFKEVDSLHSLQVPPNEREWLLRLPNAESKPAKIVLYLGCNILRTSHLVRTVVDIFKLLEVDFVAVGGPSYCCGIQHFQRGDETAGLAMAQSTVDGFLKFQPERVVMWCPSCIYFYDEIMQIQDRISFQHVTEFLVENLNRLDFQPQSPARVSLHYHTGRYQSDLEAQSAFTLLENLPGIEPVDLGTDLRLGRHCTAAVREKVGSQEWDAMVTDSIQKAVDSKVDVYSTLYHGCQRALCSYERDYSLKVEHYLEVVGRALGVEHHDLYKKYMLLGDADAILTETSPCATDSGLYLADAREVIQKTFVDSQV